jgi:regulator of sigma E protease
MIVLVKIAQFILSLSVIVIVHEFGHFLFAKLFKTRVEKFYLFFDPWFSIFKIKKGDTEYGVGWLPLGGYVKISGMIDESMDKEQMKKPPQPYEFRSKPAWQRLVIMVGGVTFNFILAAFLYVAVLFTWGETYLPTSNVKYGIVTDSVGYELGLRNGDMIESLDGEYIDNFRSIMIDLVLNERQVITVRRDGQLIDIQVKKELIPLIIKGEGRLDARIPYGPFVIEGFQKESPALEAGILKGDQIIGFNGEIINFYDEFQKFIIDKAETPITVNLLRNGDTINVDLVTTAERMIGVERLPPAEDYIELKTIKYSLLQSVPAGINMGIETFGNYLKQFKIIFSKDTKAYESLGGFITIGKIFPSKWDWYQFWKLTAFLSIVLGIMNILPIPALDGGHVLFLLIEVVTGRRPSDKFLEYAQLAGMIILIALLLFANGNDIIRELRK